MAKTVTSPLDTKVTKASTKQPTVKLLTGGAAIEAAITSIAKRGKLFERDLHTVAVSTLDHAIKHGDITLANKLIAALGKSQRVNALRDWYINFGPFSYDATNKTMVHVKGSNKTDLNAAMATPFWEFKQEAAYVPFNLEVAISRVIKQMDNAEAKGEKIDPKAKATLLSLVTAKPATKATKDPLAA